MSLCAAYLASLQSRVDLVGMPLCVLAEVGLPAGGG